MSKSLVLTILVLILLLCNTLLAQQRINSPASHFQGGIMVGGVASQVDGDDYDGYHRFAPIGGFWVKYNFKKKHALRLEFRYIGKGSLQNEGTGVERRQVYSISLHYLELPLLYEYYLFYKFTMAFGVSAGYLLTARESNRYGNLLSGRRKTFLPYELAAHARGTWQFNKHFDLTLGYSYSILPVRGVMAGWYGRNGQYNNIISLAANYTF